MATIRRSPRFPKTIALRRSPRFAQGASSHNEKAPSLSDNSSCSPTRSRSRSRSCSCSPTRSRSRSRSPTRTRTRSCSQNRDRSRDSKHDSSRHLIESPSCDDIKPLDSSVTENESVENEDESSDIESESSETENVPVESVVEATKNIDKVREDFISTLKCFFLKLRKSFSRSNPIWCLLNRIPHLSVTFIDRRFHIMCLEAALMTSNRVKTYTEGCRNISSSISNLAENLTIIEYEYVKGLIQNILNDILAYNKRIFELEKQVGL